MELGLSATTVPDFLIKCIFVPYIRKNYPVKVKLVKIPFAGPMIIKNAMGKNPMLRIVMEHSSYDADKLAQIL